MKKLVLTLLMSCVVGTVSASDELAPESTSKQNALWVLQNAGTRVMPAVAGYVLAGAVKERVGSYGFMAFLGLALVPFALDAKKVQCYDRVPETAKIVLKSLATGVVAGVVTREVVPAAARKVAALRAR